jgi:hypothetical protein
MATCSIYSHELILTIIRGENQFTINGLVSNAPTANVVAYIYAMIRSQLKGNAMTIEFRPNFFLDFETVSSSNGTELVNMIKKHLIFMETIGHLNNYSK